MMVTARAATLALAALLLALPAAAEAPDATGHGDHRRYQPPDLSRLGGPFSLTDEHGRLVTEKDFAGKYALIYFGYGRCGEACPIALETIAAALDELGSRAEQVVPVFVDFDLVNPTPEPIAAAGSGNTGRQTITLPNLAEHAGHVQRAAAHEGHADDAPMTGEELGAWVRGFHPRFVALTGTRKQIFEAARAFEVRRDHVPARRGKEKENGFRIDHTTHVYLLDPNGQVVAVLGYGESPETMAAKLKEQIVPGGEPAGKAG
jgi:cytochrome oxidase Cu insertion factor (SCO1/SenC/PrrC family)